MNATCEQLDDYLADWLSETKKSEFEAHLDECHRCRRNVELQRRIDRLLVQGVERVKPVPASLMDSVETRINSSRRRGVQIAWGASICVVLALLVGVLSTIQQPERFVRKNSEPNVATEHGGPPATPARQAKDGVQIVLSDPSSAILVPTSTEAPNVSIVWVYPTLQRAGTGSRSDVN